MFDRKEFIRSFSLLGERMLESPFYMPFLKAYRDNPFFTLHMTKTAFRNIAEKYLSEDALERLLSYSDSPGEDINLFRNRMEEKIVFIIMAGNIPAVGFHDMLCVLSTGARARVKLSSKDRFLIPSIVDCLMEISPELASRVSFEEDSILSRLVGKIDFLLFSGSNSTKSLLKDEFPGVSMLARGSRFSLGVLDGNETDEDLARLAEDMFLYGGMGCRSISYLFLPQGFDIQRIVKASQCMEEHLAGIEPLRWSYLKLKATCVIDDLPWIDGSFFFLEESDVPFPPLGCVRYAFYRSSSEIDSFCSFHRDEIQKKYTNFGNAQRPETDDWMDGINTVQSVLEGCKAYYV